MSFSEEVLDQAARADAGLRLNSRAISFLHETRKWAHLLAILGFIGVGFVVLTGIFMGSIMGTAIGIPEVGAAGGFISIFMYMVMALIYFFPVMYLYRFSSRLKHALNTNDSKALEIAFENLKSHYKYIGVIAIIIIAFYFLTFFFILIAGVGSMTFLQPIQ